MKDAKHEPVLLEEIVKNLHIKNQGRYIDATLGAGGYTKAILDEGGTVLGIDADPTMIQIASTNLKRFVELKPGQTFTVVQGNFKDLALIAKEQNFTNVDGIVFDLGVSNVHFTDENRGFSFRNENADLDMRLDPTTQSVKAADLLNLLRQDQLEKILGKSLAKKVVEARKTKPFAKVGDLLALIGEGPRGKKIHPATLPFMQLRIAVNSELENLREVLPVAFDLLNPGGRLVVVSFHSLEDEIVKDFIREKGGKNEFIKPSEEEIKRNPKSRSAILRVLEK